MASHSFIERLWYRLLQGCCQFGGLLMYRLRSFGTEYIPASGGAMVLCNHQSHLDPMLVGAVCRRRMSYLARQSLFDFAPLGWLIRSLGGIAIDREGSGFGGLKQTLKLLKNDELVLIFPEGTRSFDGELGELMAGFCTIAKRVKVPIVPAAIEGAFHAWPRTRNFPRPGRVVVEFGAPLAAEEVARLSEAELLAEVGRRIRQCHEAARARLNSAKSPDRPVSTAML